MPDRNSPALDAAAGGSASRKFARAFGNLKVRPKLIVLHNLFFLVLASAIYLTLIPFFPEQLHGRAGATLLVVLGVIYLLAVALLELVILPVYVYGPIQRVLDADEATRRGEHGRELIPEELILGDEIGQIMRSRNAVVAELRRHEDELAAALKRLEQVAADLQRKNEMLESHDRLVSLGLLSASVAHEINTPLAVLHGSIEKLLETVRDPAAQDRLARMRRVTERLRRISEGLLDFAKSRKPGMQRAALRDMVEEAWNLVGIDEKAREVRFENHVPAACAVFGNADRLVQVFVNLLRNALHAVAPGGLVSVEAGAVRLNGRDWIVVRVEDDGPGIPAELLPNIFEAFVTTRLDARGTGLGLAVAEGIVSQHGGTIEASNRPGGGARLEIRLPAAE